MLCNSILESWDTPIASASSVAIESIEADGYLSVTLRANVLNQELLIYFRFLNYQWYQLKRIATGYCKSHGRTQIHENHSETNSDTSTIMNLNAMKRAIAEPSDCMLSALPYSACHYVIIEDNSEIEIIATEKPTISLLGKSPLVRGVKCLDFDPKRSSK